MTSVRHLGLSQEGIDCGYPLARWCLLAPFFAKVDPLLVSHQADVATLLAVTKSGYGQQPKGTKKQATPEPSDAAMAFVLSNGSAKGRTAMSIDCSALIPVVPLAKSV